MALFKKKPKTENLEVLRDITDDVIEGDFVPYACHWDPYTIVTKNGEILQSIKITGFTHEQLTQEEDETDLRSRIREAVLTCIDSTQYAVWVHTIRRKANLQTGGEFKRDFAGYLNRFWNDRNDWEHQFTNEVYITVVREGQNASLFDPAGFMRGIIPRVDGRYRERFIDDACVKLNAVMLKMMPVLESYGARRLGISERGGVMYSDFCGFLGKLITMLDIDFPVTDVDLSHYLTDYDVTFGFNAMEVRMRSDGRRRFGAILTLKEYRELAVETLDRILQIPAEFIITQCFDFINAKAALKGYDYQRHLFEVSKTQALLEKTGLKDILASNRGKVTDYGLHQLNVFLLADSLRALEAGVTKAVSGLTSLGMAPLREDIKFEECYWAQLPANFEFIRRMRPLNTARIAGLANLSNFPAGKKDGNHWGPAVTTFHTAARTPYFFNFHEKDNGHTTIIGPEGAGKTVLMNFLLAQACKFDGRLFLFDNDRNSEIFLRSLGGAYYMVWPKADTQPYARLSLNPFQLDENPGNREFLRNWMLSLVGSQDPNLLAACDRAIEQIAARPRPERRLGLCVEALSVENPEFARLFAPWVGGGEFAALFDHAEDTLQFTDKIYGFDMSDVMRHASVMVPVVSYLLHRIMLVLDGTPTIVAMTEAWSLLDSPLFSSRLKEWLDMLRADNAMALLATEQVAQASGSSINASLMEHIATQIYLPDEAADNSYTEAFGLLEKEISYLTVMNTEDRHFLLKRNGNAIVAELNLAGMTDIVAVLSSSPASLQSMDKAIAEHGLQPSRWMPKFLENI
jgi:type IV secretion system protein VirB4